MDDDRYTPIAEHGLIGDMRSAALVGSDGRIDWFCCPRFDSPSVFGALLDTDRGGHWSVAPAAPAGSRQFYAPDSNVLITRFSTDSGMVEVEDCMPVVRAHDPDHRQRLVRRVRAVRGELPMRMEVAPRFDYGRASHTAVLAELAHEPGGTSAGGAAPGPAATVVAFDGPGLRLVLTGSQALVVDAGDATAEFVLAPGQEATFVLEVLAGADRRADTVPRDPVDVDALVGATLVFWRGWLAGCRYTGRWREAVRRSALTLKLLTHEPSGAVVAAPTMGLPEHIGGPRNWDYRYVWVRDGAFSVYALLQLGFVEEAIAFVGWLSRRVDEALAAGAADSPGGPLRIMYDIDGRSTAGEEVLGHWEGYRGSAPVRVRNDAADHLQLDIYGELINSIALLDEHATGIHLGDWRKLQAVVAWLQRNWDRPDEGIWEVRAGRRHHTYSRMMCWVAMDRMVRMATQRGLPGDVVDWSRTRDAIFEDTVRRGWNTELGAFTQALDGEVLDASVLLMPAVGFLSPTDPLFTSTLEAVEDSLVADSLVFRYDPAAAPDGLEGAEGTFSLCSFWYVEALTRAGRTEEARLALEKMFTYASPLGLYAEQIGLTGEQLGNFPQAFTHLALIVAAINLDRALD